MKEPCRAQWQVLVTVLIAVQPVCAQDKTTASIEKTSRAIASEIRIHSVSTAVKTLTEGRMSVPMRLAAVKLLSSGGNLSERKTRDALLKVLRKDKDRRVREAAGEALLPLYAGDAQVRSEILKYLKNVNEYDFDLISAALNRANLCLDPGIIEAFDYLKLKGYDPCGVHSEL